jgi:hypothetical protein
MWDYSKYHEAGQTDGNEDVLRLNIDLSERSIFIVFCSCWNPFISYFPFWQVNWFRKTPTDSENLLFVTQKK